MIAYTTDRSHLYNPPMTIPLSYRVNTPKSTVFSSLRVHIGLPTLSQLPISGAIGIRWLPNPRIPRRLVPSNTGCAPPWRENSSAVAEPRRAVGGRTAFTSAVVSCGASYRFVWDATSAFAVGDRTGCVYGGLGRGRDHVHAGWGTEGMDTVPDDSQLKP